MERHGYTIIDKDHLIMTCTFPEVGAHSFVVYRYDADERFPIHICENFRIRTDGRTVYVEICDVFDRRLTVQSIEELDRMTLAELKDEAYGSYMDGEHA